MKKRYKRRIYEFAEKALIVKIEKTIEPYFDHIPSEIRDEIKKEVINFPLPDEEQLGPRNSLGSRLQSLGREIADDLLSKIVNKTIPFIEEYNKKREETLAENRISEERIKADLDNLKNRLHKARKCSKRYWRGADIIITPKKIPSKNLAWTDTGDIQLVTGTEELASALTWLFKQIGTIMNTFLDYQNKYFFYGELAKTANKAIANKSNELDDKDIFLAVLAETENFRKQSVPGLKKYFDKEEMLLNETEIWVKSMKGNYEII